MAEKVGVHHHDVIVIGASAGGIEVLQKVLAALPADLGAAVLVVLHMPASGGRALERIISRATEMKVTLAEDGEPLEYGRIYISPGGSQLLVAPGHVQVRKGSRDNRHRPAVNPLFRSAAAHYGSRVIGIVLSGNLNDGTAGLYAIKARGGTAVVQDPEDALYSSMPASASAYVEVDYVTSARDLGPLITKLVSEGVEVPDVPLDHRLQLELERMSGDDRVGEEDHPGVPSPWPCPDCNGVRREIHEGPILRFPGRVGHAWAAESLLQEQGKGIEAALWMALRALEDRAALSKKLAERADETGRHHGAGRYRGDLDAMARSIETLRKILSHERAGFGALDEPLHLVEAD